MAIVAIHVLPRYSRKATCARSAPMSVEEHENLARTDHKDTVIGVAILTVSDSRTPENDTGGKAMESLLKDAGHQVNFRTLVPDEGAEIRAAILAAASTEGVHAIMLTGGTGISKRDGTPEVLRSISGIDVEGFGELFRSLSFAAIGPAALLSRATARVLEFENGHRVPVFAMPGSVHAVETAMKELILPLLLHTVWQTSN